MLDHYSQLSSKYGGASIMELVGCMPVTTCLPLAEHTRASTFLNQTIAIASRYVAFA
jgi:hypothetical protein